MSALLLDTHVWIWLLAGETRRLANPVLQRIQNALLQGDVVVSDVSVWEIALKTAKGKLVLTPSLDDWLAQAEKAPGISFLPLDRSTLVLSARVPGLPHGDPADRILAAAALKHDLELVTADPVLIESAERAGYGVLDARP